MVTVVPQDFCVLRIVFECHEIVLTDIWSMPKKTTTQLRPEVFIENVYFG